MQIFVNGDSRQISDDIRTLSELIDNLDVESTEGMAVAVNEQVVPGSQWPETHIEEGDDIEVIRATQGG